MNAGAHNLCRVTQGWVRRILAASATLCFAVALQSPVCAAETTSQAKKATDSTDAFFNDSAVRLFEFEISPSALNELRRSPRTYVRSVVREGGQVLTNVGIHLKGMGSFRTVDEKASFSLKFDEFAENQEYCGLTKLMFNNSVQDPTYIVEGLATELFRDAGLPAARVTHARLRLNGRDLGLYVVIEAMNKRFLKRHFQSAKGNLYEAYVRDIDPPMDQDNGEDTTQADVRALIAACAIQEPSRRFQRLREVLDVDQFVSFAAMEILVGHWDGYTIHTNNYRLYHEPVADKMHFITHGLDWAFRRPNISIEPPLKSMVGRAVFQTAEGRKMFQERIGTLFTNVFRVSIITNRLEQALARLRVAGGLNPSERARMERAAASIRERIELRGVRVAEQLAGIQPPQIQFDADNSARLTGWRDEYDRGEMTMDQPEFEQHRTLHLKAGGGRSRGSWRTQVFLPRGRYRFEGMIRCVGLAGGSAGLRISGGQRNNGVSGQTGWRTISHDFEVTENGLDVEFVCDFYGTAGDVWFDREAFRLRKQ
jgi:hypothetical protein